MPDVREEVLEGRGNLVWKVGGSLGDRTQATLMVVGVVGVVVVVVVIVTVLARVKDI